jgi:hypothetical protein
LVDPNIHLVSRQVRDREDGIGKAIKM